MKTAKSSAVASARVWTFGRPGGSASATRKLVIIGLLPLIAFFMPGSASGFTEISGTLMSQNGWGGDSGGRGGSSDTNFFTEISGVLSMTAPDGGERGGGDSNRDNHEFTEISGGALSPVPFGDSRRGDSGGTLWFTEISGTSLSTLIPPGDRGGANNGDGYVIGSLPFTGDVGVSGLVWLNDVGRLPEPKYLAPFHDLATGPNMPGGLAVPEPSSVALLLLASGYWLKRRRGRD